MRPRSTVTSTSSVARRPAPAAAAGGRRARCRRVDRRRLSPKAATIRGSPAQLRGSALGSVWWQWTTWPRLVMTDFARTAGPDVLVAGGQDLDLLLGSLAAYLHALEARVAALERRLSAVPLMTAADAARSTRVNVATILRAVRAGELPAAGYIGRSPRISRDALSSWLAARSAAAAPASSQPRRHRRRKGSDAVEAAWQALG